MWIQTKDSTANYRLHESEKDGTYVEWHSNGRKKTIRHYKNGKENGVRTEWDEGGKKTFQGNFVDGNEE
jgi:antitoxin component YwqK of YwqJK toxin-antitoxin module